MNASATSAPEETRRPLHPGPADQGRAEHDAAARVASLDRLAVAFGQVKRLCPDVPVLAIHWMHLKHPIHPVQEELLAREEASTPERARIPSYGALITGFGVCLLYAGYLTWRFVQLRWALRRPLNALRQAQFDLVAKTWRFGAANGAEGRDFYYGDLQRRLAERGVRLLLVCKDARGRGWRDFARANVSADGPGYQVPEWCLVPLGAPWAMACRQLASAIRLRRLAVRERPSLLQAVAARASAACVSRQIMPTGLNYWTARALVRQWRPRAVLTLYEGYGWEQCAWRGVQAADPTCRRLGYQHTILLRHNRALLAPLAAEHAPCRPDAALCLGSKTRAMLAPSHPHATLITFGTFRATPGRSASQPPEPQRRTVIVLPEGYLDESARLFNVALEVAERLPEHRFILRLHPMLSLAQVRPHLTQDPDRLANVELSPGGPIEKDFARSSVVVYRGSSSVLYAVAYGLKPVYLRAGLQHDIDPLFEVEGWRERADTPAALAALLERYAQTDRVAAAEVWRETAEYVEHYAVPVSGASLDQLLEAVGMTAGAPAPCIA